MKRELFSLGPVTIYGYGLMIAIGVLAAFLVAEYRAKRIGMDAGRIYSLGFRGLLGGLLGAKLLYWLTNIQSIAANPAMLLDVSDGFVVYGGIIGGIFAGFLYCRRKRLPFFGYLDLFIPSVALAQGFGRIGCFLAGCCHGLETTSRFGVVFPPGSLAPHDVRLIPTQLIASGLDFLLFGALLLFSGKKCGEGQVAAVYLILYSAGRFALEFLRGDTGRGFIGALSTSQFIAVFLFFAGCFLYLYRGRKRLSRYEVPPKP